MQGTYLYPDSSLYTGSWKAGKKHGQGKFRVQGLGAVTETSGLGSMLRIVRFYVVWPLPGTFTKSISSKQIPNLMYPSLDSNKGTTLANARCC